MLLNCLQFTASSNSTDFVPASQFLFHNLSEVFPSQWYSTRCMWEVCSTNGSMETKFLCHWVFFRWSNSRASLILNHKIIEGRFTSSFTPILLQLYVQSIINHAFWVFLADKTNACAFAVSFTFYKSTVLALKCELTLESRLPYLQNEKENFSRTQLTCNSGMLVVPFDCFQLPYPSMSVWHFLLISAMLNLRKSFRGLKYKMPR